MKNILLIKRLDLYAQLLFVLLIFICFALQSQLISALGLYVIFGMYQVASSLLNKIFLRKQFKSNFRIGYELLMLFIIICCATNYYTREIYTPLCLTLHPASERLLAFFFLGLSPFMAVGYILITLAELKTIKKASETYYADKSDISQ